MKKKTLLNLFISAVLVLMGTVTYGQSTDLSALSITPGSLNETFDGVRTSFTANFLYATSSITVTASRSAAAVTAGSTMSLSLNGGAPAALTDATASSSQAITVAGPNVITITVTDPNGGGPGVPTTKDYTITVTRAAASSNADLSALTISAGTLAPVFASGTLAYTATVNYATSSVTETPTVADATATIQIRVNGGGWTSVTSGSASGSLALNVGTNPIDVKVTAQDGVTTKTYTTTVTQQSWDAKLSALTTSSGALSPAFASTTYTGYSAPGILYADAFTVTPTVNESHATVQISLDNATWSPATSGVANSVALAVGSNNVYVKVTAEDVSYTHTYLFTVTRAPKSTDATLSNLVATTATFSSPFVSSI